jgi:3-isopropylmalate/(R)-2-methylmalate dehydratase small subunit
VSDACLQLQAEGRTWKFGDQINTDLILPAAAMRLPVEQMHSMAFEAIRPGWVRQARAGDILVAGANFGLGSSRPVGSVLRACGIVAVLADSINGLGYRTCINSGLPLMAVPGVSALFQEGDVAAVDFTTGTVVNRETGAVLRGPPMAPELADIIRAGGVVPMLVAGGYIESKAFAARAA